MFSQALAIPCASAAIERDIIDYLRELSLLPHFKDGTAVISPDLIEELHRIIAS